MKKKILVVTNIYPTASYPQSGTFVHNSVVGLRNFGFLVDVCFLDEWKIRNNSISKLLKVFNYFSFYFRSILKLLVRNYDIVYCHYVSHSSLPVILMKILKNNFIYVSHVHGSDVLQESGVSGTKFRVKKYISQVALNHSDFIVSPSEYYRDSVICPLYNINREKVYISPSGGVNISIFAPSPNRTKSINNSLRIGFIGRLTEDKGVFDFIDLCKGLLSSNINLSVVIVGDGPLVKEVEAFVKIYNVEYYRHLEQSKLPQIYQTLDLFIFPTTRITESLGLVGLEAMACGVPVVAYDVGGPSDYISHCYDSYLVPKGDINELQRVVLGYSKLTLCQRNTLSVRAILKANQYCSEKVNFELSSFFCKVI